MMSNTLGILLSFFWLSLVQCDDRGVYYDLANRSWFESSANCQQLGARKEGDFSITGLRVPTRPSGFRQDQFFWIGAGVIQSRWIKLLGCFETYDSTKHMIFTMVRPLPTKLPLPLIHCDAFCDIFPGITAIGISKTSCHCYTDVEKYRKRIEHCEYETLPDYPDELFGGPKNESVVVYQYIKHAPLSQVHDSGNCAAVRYLGSLPVHHQFSSCLNRIGYMCANGQVSTTEVTWTEAVKRCGTLKTDLNGYYTGLTDSLKYRAFWTGFYRRSDLLWMTHEKYFEPVCQHCVSTNPVRMHCVAVKVNDDGTLDSIIYPQDCSKKLPSLCEKSTKVDGGWTEWSLWSECVIGNDGQGTRKKSRTCTNPSPQHGGKDCEGDGEKEENCTPPKDEL